MCTVKEPGTRDGGAQLAPLGTEHPPSLRLRECERRGQKDVRPEDRNCAADRHFLGMTWPCR